jgi:CAI-1 autoinducer synthase
VFHNEVEHLERQILRHGPGVVVVDSIYSTTGSIAPLREIVEICEAQGCILVADESHSLGTHGPNGEGLVVELGLAERVHFRTASLAKAFAGRAGFVTCSRRFAEYFKSESNPAIFSSTLLPHDIHGLAATLGVIRQEGWRRERLRENAAYLRPSWMPSATTSTAANARSFRWNRVPSRTPSCCATRSSRAASSVRSSAPRPRRRAAP